MAPLVHPSEVGTAGPGIAPNHHSSPRPTDALRTWRGCWIHGARICCFHQGSSRPSASKKTFPPPPCPGPNLPGVSCLGASLHRQKICFARFFVCLFVFSPYGTLLRKGLPGWLRLSRDEIRPDPPASVSGFPPGSTQVKEEMCPRSRSKRG